MDQRVRGPSHDSLQRLVGPFEQRRSGASREPNSLSFALPILSLCYSYANRLLTFVKIKRRDEGRRRTKGDRESKREIRRASESRQETILYFPLSSTLAGCPQFLLLLRLLLPLVSPLRLLFSARHSRDSVQLLRDRRSPGDDGSQFQSLSLSREDHRT